MWDVNNQQIQLFCQQSSFLSANKIPFYSPMSRICENCDRVCVRDAPTCCSVCEDTNGHDHLYSCQCPNNSGPNDANCLCCWDAQCKHIYIKYFQGGGQMTCTCLKESVVGEQYCSHHISEYKNLPGWPSTRFACWVSLLITNKLNFIYFTITFYSSTLALTLALTNMDQDIFKAMAYLPLSQVYPLNHRSDCSKLHLAIRWF